MDWWFSQLLYGNSVPPIPAKITKDAQPRSSIQDFDKYRTTKRFKKMVRYQCKNSGDGTERFIEEGTMSHRCPHCIYDGKPDPCIYLNGMVCPIVNKAPHFR